MRLLVIEDDHLLNNILCYNLSVAAYNIDAATTKATAIDQIRIINMTQFGQLYEKEKIAYGNQKAKKQSKWLRISAGHRMSGGTSALRRPEWNGEATSLSTSVTGYNPSNSSISSSAAKTAASASAQ